MLGHILPHLTHDLSDSMQYKEKRETNGTENTNDVQKSGTARPC